MRGEFWKLVYPVVVIIAVIVEHKLFAKRWARHELARRTMGIATVLALALPWVLLDHFDRETYLWIWAAFGAAGAVVGAMYINNNDREAERKRREIYGRTKEALKQ
jgi:hypothetical protein